MAEGLSQQCHAGVDLVGGVRQIPQHEKGFLLILRFAEDPPVVADYGIGPEDEGVFF